MQVNTGVRNGGTAALSVSWSPVICHPARDIVPGRQQVTTSRKSATFVGSSPLTRKAQLQRDQRASHNITKPHTFATFRQTQRRSHLACRGLTPRWHDVRRLLAEHCVFQDFI